MTPWLMALALAAAPAQTSPAMLGFVDAAKLGELCATTGASARDALPICLGYITGSVDQILTEQAKGPRQNRTICPPAGISAQDVMATVVRYADWSRSAQGISAAGFVKFAMEEAYPCGDDDREIM